MHIFCLLEWINISTLTSRLATDTRAVKITRSGQFSIKRAGVCERVSIWQRRAGRGEGGLRLWARGDSSTFRLTAMNFSKRCYCQGGAGRGTSVRVCVYVCVCACVWEWERLWPAQPSSPVHVCWRSVTGSKLHLINWYERREGWLCVSVLERHIKHNTPLCNNLISDAWPTFKRNLCYGQES